MAHQANEKGKGMTEQEFRSRDDTVKAQVDPMMQFFGNWPHEGMAADQAVTMNIIGNKFEIMALDLVSILPRNPERTVALRKLLEARDCAMRAAVMK